MLQQTPRTRWTIPLICALLACATMSSAGPKVMVVRGTASMPNAAERHYGKRVAERLCRWLDELGIGHELVTDDDIGRAVPRSCKVLLLAYNPNPPASQLAAIAAHLERGGGVIVFYSASARLAQLMGMTLGEYQGFKRRGHWAVIRFHSAAIPHMPSVVRQHSRNIRPARPVRGMSHVLAEWYTEDGRATGDPAWVMSDQGAWMSHILLDDDDVESKKIMLAALIGQRLPGVWQAVSRRFAEAAVSLRPGMSFGESIGRIRSIARPNGRYAAVAPLIQSARIMHQQIETRMADGNYSGVITVCQSLGSTLSTAYATAQQSRWPEWRGVWDHDGTGLYAGDWDRTAAELAALGVTDILSNVLWPGTAHFPVAGLEATGVLSSYGDQLQQGIDAASRHGLRYHAWKVCWKLGPGTEALAAKLGAEGRLQVDLEGRQRPWLCPTQLANRQLELAGLRTILRQYPVTGIHLDYIRYPDSQSCYCERCEQKFRRDTGVTVSHWPRDVSDKGPHTPRFRDWRCRQISTFVEACRNLINSVNPDVRLSAAVYGRYPLCKQSVAQDWMSWLENDWVDFLCPMDYTDDPLRFAGYVASQIQGAGGRAGRVFPGIGVTAAESRLSGVEVTDQVLELRRAGARGFALFDLNPVLVRDVLPLLRMGVLAPAEGN